MNTVTSNQRTINILNKALELGFEFNENNTLEEIRISAEEYLIDNTEAIEEECEVKSLGNHGQRVDYSDGLGYEYWSQGEIVNFDGKSEIIIHTTVVNSLGNVIDLFCKNTY